MATRFGWLVAVMVMAYAGAGWCGLNPVDPLLPVAQAYGTSYANNEASSMCIDCHTPSPVRNPGNPMPRTGTHFVDHFDGAGVQTTTPARLAWEFTTPWPTSGASSKYAVPAPPDPTSTSVPGAQGELICESCHSLVTNVAGGNNLVATYDEAEDPVPLCEGCHTVQAAGPPGHHAQTGDLVGADQDDPTPHTLDTSHASHVRGTPAAGSEVTYTAVAGVSCASCHEPHGGQEQTQAKILKRGWSAVASIPGVLGKPVNVVYYADMPAGYSPGDVVTPATGDIVPGIARVEPWNTDPLCDACHPANDP